MNFLFNVKLAKRKGKEKKIKNIIVFGGHSHTFFLNVTWRVVNSQFHSPFFFLKKIIIIIFFGKITLIPLYYVKIALKFFKTKFLYYRGKGGKKESH